MTIESELVILSTSTTALTTAVDAQQTDIDAQVALFASTTAAVNALNLVDNTPDTTKPLSNDAITEFATKQDTLVSASNIATINGDSLLNGGDLVVVRAPTEIATNTWALRATLRTLTGSLPGDSIVVEGLGLFQFVNTELEPDDDETCFTVSGITGWASR